MPGDKYEKYGRPLPPSDPNAEYMTVQETAYVLKISVRRTRQLIKEHGGGARPGRRIVTNAADRERLYAITRQPAKRRPARNRLANAA